MTNPARKGLLTQELHSGTAALLDSSQAAAYLGVSKPTLYAYVSRGLLSAVAMPGDPRARRYSSFELDMLARRRGQAKREQQTLSALNEGWPVLDTALSCIQQGQPVYRGQQVLDVARLASVEDVARLLWQFDGHDPFAADPPLLGAGWQRLAAELAPCPLPERTLALFALALSELQGPAWLGDGEAMAQACGQHLRVAVAAFLARQPQALPLHLQFVQAYGLQPEAAEALRQALVLVADHEMNMVAFTARGLASVGASLGAALLGALCTLTATFNGGACPQVEALWDRLLAQPDLRTALAQHLDRGDSLPGFNHLSYPAGDPRAQHLLALAERFGPQPAVAREVERLTGWKPSVDFGLVALRRAIGAPPEAALALQMGGRCVGVIAHILEQRRSGQRIIARARYIGP